MSYRPYIHTVKGQFTKSIKEFTTQSVVYAGKVVLLVASVGFFIFQMIGISIALIVAGLGLSLIGFMRFLKKPFTKF
jgi:small neutral amino acid transporter SnatA (MarC family)